MPWAHLGLARTHVVQDCSVLPCRLAATEEHLKLPAHHLRASSEPIGGRTARCVGRQRRGRRRFRAHTVTPTTERGHSRLCASLSQSKLLRLPPDIFLLKTYCCRIFVLRLAVLKFTFLLVLLFCKVGISSTACNLVQNSGR